MNIMQVCGVVVSIGKESRRTYLFVAEKPSVTPPSDSDEKVGLNSPQRDASADVGIPVHSNADNLLRGVLASFGPQTAELKAQNATSGSAATEELNAEYHFD